MVSCGALVPLLDSIVLRYLLLPGASFIYIAAVSPNPASLGAINGLSQVRLLANVPHSFGLMLHSDDGKHHPSRRPRSSQFIVFSVYGKRIPRRESRLLFPCLDSVWVTVGGIAPSE